MSPEDSGLRKRLWSLFCTRLSHQLSLAALSDLKSVHKRGSATHHVCLFLAALLPLTACLSFCIHFSCPPFPSQPQCLSISHIFSRSCACPCPVSVEQITARCTPRCPLDSLSFPLTAATPPLPPPIFFFLAASHQSSVLQTAVGAHEDNRLPACECFCFVAGKRLHKDSRSESLAAYDLPHPSLSFSFLPSPPVGVSLITSVTLFVELESRRQRHERWSKMFINNLNSLWLAKLPPVRTHKPM